MLKPLTGLAAIAIVSALSLPGAASAEQTGPAINRDSAKLTMTDVSARRVQRRYYRYRYYRPAYRYYGAPYRYYGPPYVPVWPMPPVWPFGPWPFYW